jgi:outer membrane receptor for ferrienterochelin and colicins
MVQSHRGCSLLPSLCMFLAVMLPLSSLQAAASGEQISELKDMTLEQLMTIKIDTVYSASKYIQKVTEAPSAISIVTAEAISRHGYRDLAEILGSLRGFHVTNDRNYKYVGVRGFGLPSDYNDRILLLVDGIRQNDVIYDSAAISTEFPIDVTNINRVEVVRGPGSSLYGNSAFFAVVNVITKTPQDLNGTRFTLEASSFEMYQAQLAYAASFNNGLDLYVTGSSLGSKGDDHYYEEFDDPVTNNGVALGRDNSRAEKLFLKASYGDFTFESQYSYHKKGIPTAPWGSLFNSDTFASSEYVVVDLKYDHTYDNQLNVLGRVNYNLYEYKGEYPAEGDTDLGEAPLVNNFDSANAEWLYGEVQLDRSFSGNHRVSVGASYSNNLQQDQSTVYDGADWGYLDDTRSEDNWALYIQDEIRITDKVILNAGVRYDYFDSFGDTTNPRAALIYAASERTTIKALYGSAFRAPNVYELYFHDGGGTQKPSPNLNPETIDTFEVIIERYFDNQLLGSIGGFYNSIENLIQQTEDLDDACDFGSCLIFTNLDEVTAKGLEIELNREWAQGYIGRISYSYQETEVESTGRPMTNSPRHLAKVNATLPIYGDKIFLTVEGQYTGKRKTLMSTDTDDFFVANLTLFSEGLIKGLRVSASVYNLFDEKYFDPGAGEHLMNEIEQDGRTIRFRATYQF